MATKIESFEFGSVVSSDEHVKAFPSLVFRLNLWASNDWEDKALLFLVPTCLVKVWRGRRFLDRLDLFLNGLYGCVEPFLDQGDRVLFLLPEGIDILFLTVFTRGHPLDERIASM